MKGYIYKITSPSGKCYIGLTKNFKQRMKQHEKDSKKGKRVFYKAITKYGFNNFKKEILEVVECETREELYKKLEEKEKFYIKKFDSFNNGYNGTEGGEGTLGLFGEKNPFFNKKHKKTSIDKIREKALNRTHTKETKDKISSVLKSKNCGEKESSAKGLKKAQKVNMKKVVCVETGELFDSLTDCSIKTGINRSDIGSVCNLKRISAKGFTFRFIGDENKKPPENKRVKKIICVETNEKFESIKECCEKLGVRNQHVSAILRGKQKTTKGYSFKYDNTVPSLE